MMKTGDLRSVLSSQITAEIKLVAQPVGVYYLQEIPLKGVNCSAAIRHDTSVYSIRRQEMTDSNAPSGAQELFDGEYEPSSVERIRNQVALYESTGGTEGNTLEGRPVVILTTIGSKSRKVRKNPIMRIQKDGIYVAVASAEGAPKHPSWYGNLLAHPEIRLQDGSEVHTLRAREVFGEEKQRRWQVAERFWPHLPEYRERAAGREIPLLLLEPIAD
jgi:deazaflavin-dependent oxidoreductase (nitroreductase family)